MLVEVVLRAGEDKASLARHDVGLAALWQLSTFGLPRLDKQVTLPPTSTLAYGPVQAMLLPYTPTLSQPYSYPIILPCPQAIPP